MLDVRDKFFPSPQFKEMGEDEDRNKYGFLLEGSFQQPRCFGAISTAANFVLKSVWVRFTAEIPV